MEAVKFFWKDWDGLVQMWGGAVYVVTNEGVRESGEEMVERSKFLV